MPYPWFSSSTYTGTVTVSPARESGASPGLRVLPTDPVGDDDALARSVALSAPGSESVDFVMTDLVYGGEHSGRVTTSGF